jgi:hypothetical protein
LPTSSLKNLKTHRGFTPLFLISNTFLSITISTSRKGGESMNNLPFFKWRIERVANTLNLYVKLNVDSDVIAKINNEIYIHKVIPYFEEYFEFSTYLNPYLRGDTWHANKEKLVAKKVYRKIFDKMMPDIEKFFKDISEYLQGEILKAVNAEEKVTVTERVLLNDNKVEALKSLIASVEPDSLPIKGEIVKFIKNPIFPKRIFEEFHRKYGKYSEQYFYVEEFNQELVDALKSYCSGNCEIEERDNRLYVDDGTIIKFFEDIIKVINKYNSGLKSNVQFKYGELKITEDKFSNRDSYKIVFYPKEDMIQYVKRIMDTLPIIDKAIMKDRIYFADKLSLTLDGNNIVLEYNEDDSIAMSNVKKSRSFAKKLEAFIDKYYDLLQAIDNMHLKAISVFPFTTDKDYYVGVVDKEREKLLEYVQVSPELFDRLKSIEQAILSLKEYRDKKYVFEKEYTTNKFNNPLNYVQIRVEKNDKYVEKYGYDLLITMKFPQYKLENYRKLQKIRTLSNASDMLRNIFLFKIANVVVNVVYPKENLQEMLFIFGRDTYSIDTRPFSILYKMPIDEEKFKEICDKIERNIDNLFDILKEETEERPEKGPISMEQDGVKIAIERKYFEDRSKVGVHLTVPANEVKYYRQAILGMSGTLYEGEYSSGDTITLIFTMEDTGNNSHKYILPEYRDLLFYGEDTLNTILSRIKESVREIIEEEEYEKHKKELAKQRAEEERRKMEERMKKKKEIIEGVTELKDEIIPVIVATKLMNT